MSTALTTERAPVVVQGVVSWVMLEWRMRKARGARRAISEWRIVLGQLLPRVRRRVKVVWKFGGSRRWIVWGRVWGVGVVGLGVRRRRRMRRWGVGWGIVV